MPTTTAPPNARREQAYAILSAVETIKATGGAVEIAGVRIEPCDTYGQTHTTRALERAVDSRDEWKRLAFCAVFGLPVDVVVVDVML